MLSSGFCAAAQYIVVGSIAALIHCGCDSFTLWRTTLKHKSDYYAQKAKQAARAACRADTGPGWMAYHAKAPTVRKYNAVATAGRVA
jgi:hypothetical protein